VGRLAGDELVILVTRDVATGASDLLTELPAALGAPIPLAGVTIAIGAAYGAVIAWPGDDRAGLLAAAFSHDAQRQPPPGTPRTRRPIPRAASATGVR
jgi:predicted signal transduction protein with EAL and GGDEF domain